MFFATAELAIAQNAALWAGVLMFDELAKIPSAGAFSRVGWGALGVCEMLFAVLLVVPAAMK